MYTRQYDSYGPLAAAHPAMYTKPRKAPIGKGSSSGTMRPKFTGGPKWLQDHERAMREISRDRTSNARERTIGWKQPELVILEGELEGDIGPVRAPPAQMCVPCSHCKQVFTLQKLEAHAPKCKKEALRKEELQSRIIASQPFLANTSANPCAADKLRRKGLLPSTVDSLGGSVPAETNLDQTGASSPTFARRRCFPSAPIHPFSAAVGTQSGSEPDQEERGISPNAFYQDGGGIQTQSSPPKRQESPPKVKYTTSQTSVPRDAATSSHAGVGTSAATSIMDPMFLRSTLPELQALVQFVDVLRSGPIVPPQPAAPGMTQPPYFDPTAMAAAATLASMTRWAVSPQPGQRMAEMGTNTTVPRTAQAEVGTSPRGAAGGGLVVEDMEEQLEQAAQMVRTMCRDRKRVQKEEQKEEEQQQQQMLQQKRKLEKRKGKAPLSPTEAAQQEDDGEGVDEASPSSQAQETPVSSSIGRSGSGRGPVKIATKRGAGSKSQSISSNVSVRRQAKSPGDDTPIRPMQPISAPRELFDENDDGGVDASPGGAGGDDLAPCPHCNRRFALSRITKHISVCGESADKKRTPKSSSASRSAPRSVGSESSMKLDENTLPPVELGEPDAEGRYTCPERACRRKFNRDAALRHFPICRKHHHSEKFKMSFATGNNHPLTSTSVSRS